MIDIPTFPNIKPNKELFLKLLEESAEVYSAFEDYKEEQTCDAVHRERFDEPVDDPGDEQPFGIFAHIFGCSKDSLSSSWDKSSAKSELP